MAVMSVIRQTSDSPTITKDEKNFGICILLAVAYGASIGGMGTIIGSPPNGIFVRFVTQTYGNGSDHCRMDESRYANCSYPSPVGLASP